jgi:hypothetical protein
MPHYPPTPENLLPWSDLATSLKLPKPPRPPFDTMLAALERSSPGYGSRLVREAVDWPRQGPPTKEMIRQRVGADWDALPADQRAASRDAGQDGLAD